MDIEHLNLFVEENDDDSEDDVDVASTSSEISEGSSFTSSSSSSQKFGQCVVCSKSEPQICVLPCFEFCVCEARWNVLKNNSTTNLRCPKCQEVAKEGKKMIFAI